MLISRLVSVVGVEHGDELNDLDLVRYDNFSVCTLIERCTVSSAELLDVTPIVRAMSELSPDVLDMDETL